MPRDYHDRPDPDNDQRLPMNCPNCNKKLCVVKRINGKIIKLVNPGTELMPDD
jgi:hypothetical protein